MVEAYLTAYRSKSDGLNQGVGGNNLALLSGKISAQDSLAAQCGLLD